MVPEGWEQTRMDSLMDLVTSGSRDWAKFYSDAGSKFIRMTNLSREGINLKLDDLKFVDIQSDSSDGKRTRLAHGDILISITAELGKIGWVPCDFGEAYINQHTALVRLNPLESDSKYVAYMLSSKKMNQTINRMNDSGAKAGLNLSTIKSISVTLPPLPEQTKIAQILSTWDKAIATTEQLLSNSRQQKKALMQKLLTGKKRLLGFGGEWKEVHLADICTINPKKHPRPLDGKVTFVPMDAVTEDAKLFRYETRQYSEVEKGFTSFADNDVLIAKITPCFENGKGAFAYNLANGIGFGSTEFHVLRAKPNFCPKLIYYLTNSREFRIRGEANMQGSAGQRRVPTDYLRYYKLRIPPLLKEQQRIASVLSSTGREIETLQQELEHLKQEKKALMQQLLTGKRRVKIEG